jgi:hypothetical protein
MRGVWKGIRDVGAAHAATAQQASAVAMVSASRRTRVRLTVGGGDDEGELVRVIVVVGRGQSGLKNGVQNSFRRDVVHMAKRPAQLASMVRVDAPWDRVGLLGGVPEAAAWRRSMCLGSSGETTIDDGIRACLSKKQHGRAIALFNKHPEAHAGISAKNYQGLLVAANALERLCLPPPLSSFSSFSSFSFSSLTPRAVPSPIDGREIDNPETTNLDPRLNQPLLRPAWATVSVTGFYFRV